MKDSRTDQSVTWQFLAGLLITEAGFWLLAFGELSFPGTSMHHLSYGGVFSRRIH